MDLGNAIKQLRKHRGISQKELARLCDLTPNAMCSIENNASFPAKKTFDKICKALDMPSAYIFLFAITDEDLPEEKRDLFRNSYEKKLKDLVLTS